MTYTKEELEQNLSYEDHRDDRIAGCAVSALLYRQGSRVSVVDRLRHTE